MSQMKEAEVYRVCTGATDRWHVFEEQSEQPVASFDEKAAAINYAMCLARGRVAWHLLLRQPEVGSSNARNSSGSSH